MVIGGTAALQAQVQEVKAKSLQTLMAVLDEISAISPASAPTPARSGMPAPGGGVAPGPALQSQPQSLLQAVVLLPPQGNRLTIALGGLPLEVILPEPVLNQVRANPGLLARGQEIGVEVNLSAGTLRLALPSPAPAILPNPATTRLITGQNPGPSAPPAPPLPDFFPAGSPGALIQKLSGLALPLAELGHTEATTWPRQPALPPQAAKATPGLASLPAPVLDAALRASFRQMPIGSAITALLRASPNQLDASIETSLRALRLDAGLPAQAAKIQQIVAHSGLFTEARLAQMVQTPARPIPPSGQGPFEAPQMPVKAGFDAAKPAQITAQTETTVAARAAPPVNPAPIPVAPDLKSLLLRALQTLPTLARTDQAVPASPTAQPDRPSLTNPQQSSLEKPAREMPSAGPRPASQPPAPAELARLVEGAIERIKLHQIASLPEHPNVTVTDDRAQPVRLAMQLPLAIHGPDSPDTAMIGLMIERETRPDPATQSVEDREAQGEGEAAPWKVRIALDLEETGPVQAEIALRGPRVAVTLWAERRATAESARASISALHQALVAQNFDVGPLEIRDGRPSGPSPRHLPSLDRRS